MTKKVIGFTPEKEAKDVVQEVAIVYNTDDYISEAYSVLFDLLRANRKIKGVQITVDFTGKKKIVVSHF